MVFNIKIDLCNINNNIIEGSYIITTDNKGNIKRIKSILLNTSNKDLIDILNYFTDLFDFLRNIYCIVNILPEKNLICFNGSIKNSNINLKDYQFIY